MEELEKNFRRVVCQRTQTRVKGKVYKTEAKPALIYATETWPVNKTQEKKIDVVEMSMFRSMLGVTKMDKIKNEGISGTAKLVATSKKIQ